VRGRVGVGFEVGVLVGVGARGRVRVRVIGSSGVPVQARLQKAPLRSGPRT